MSRHSKHAKPSPETRKEAMSIARGTQRPGQTKEQTRLIAQGIQQGIDLYKKQQKAKARDLDKMRHKQPKAKDHKAERQASADIRYRQHWLPWLLLVITWTGIGLYLVYLARGN